MKKIFLLLVTLIFSLEVFAQKEVTKFLGIPVDGFKPQMIEKLKAKGFTESPSEKGVLEGEFNGEDVYVHVVTDNNKVYRIAVIDKNTRSAGDIRIRFNRLVSQFEKNKKYITLRDYNLSEDEDIEYNIIVEDKRYEAVYYQIPSKLTHRKKEDATEVDYKRSVWFMISKSSYDEYNIKMFYDNVYNQADGEDL